MAKKTKSEKDAAKPSRELPENGEYNLPIEPKPGRSAGSGVKGRRLMLLLSLALGVGAGLLVWWLGSNL